MLLSLLWFEQKNLHSNSSVKTKNTTMFAIASNSIGAVIIRTVLFAKLVTSLSTTTNRSHLTGKQTRVEMWEKKGENSKRDWILTAIDIFIHKNMSSVESTSDPHFAQLRRTSRLPSYCVWGNRMCCVVCAIRVMRSTMPKNRTHGDDDWGDRQQTAGFEISALHNLVCGETRKNKQHAH
jgi:hypothetical protein